MELLESRSTGTVAFVPPGSATGGDRAARRPSGTAGRERSEQAGRRQHVVTPPLGRLTPCGDGARPSGGWQARPVGSQARWPAHRVDRHPFKVVSDFEPAGDQPKAIEQLDRGHRAGRAVPDPARHHRLGQERHHRLDHRAGAAAHAGASRPTSRWPPSWPTSSGSSSPTTGSSTSSRYYDYYQPEAYMAASRHLHREGLVGERRDRPAAPLGHLGAAHPARRHRGGVGVVHLRPRLARGVPRPAARACARATSYDQRAILRKLVDMQYERNDMNLVRGKFRVRGDTIEVHPAYDETAVRIELFGDEIEHITVVDPLTGEQVDDARRARRLPGHPLRRRRGAACRRPSCASRRSCRSGWPTSRRRASCSRPSACACAPSTTSR